MPRILAIVLATLLAMTTTAAATTVTPINPDKLSSDLRSFGIGRTIRVKQTDGTVLRGQLLSIGVRTFDLVPQHATQPVTLPFNQVASVKTGLLPTARRNVVDIGEGAAGAVLFCAWICVSFVTGLVTLGHHPIPPPA